MTTAELADLLSRLVGEAEDAGLDPQEILAEIEDIAAAMRLGALVRHGFIRSR